jgi:signal transduction histidine kinase
LYSRWRNRLFPDPISTSRFAAPSFESIHIVPAARLIVASGFLLATWTGPLGVTTPEYALIARLALTVYVLYSLVLCYRVHRPIYLWLLRIVPVFALCTFVALLTIASGNGLGAICLGLFFAILMGARTWGFKAVMLAAAATTCILAVGIVRGWSEPAFRLTEVWLSSLILFILGYLTADMGGVALERKRQVALLEDLINLSNPRFGADRTITALMAKLLTYKTADICLLNLTGDESGQYVVRHNDVAPGHEITRHESGPISLDRVMDLPVSRGIIFRRHRYLTWLPIKRYSEVNVANGKFYVTVSGQESAVDEVATILKVDSLISVPLSLYGQAKGRLYLGTRRPFQLGRSDVCFLHSVMERMLPLIENIRVLDRLASEAAIVEREKIARDIHDSVIQPYIGIQMGLAGIREKVRQGNLEVAQDIDRLMEVTDLEVSGLRELASEVKAPVEPDRGLLSALRRYVDRFSSTTNISVELQAEDLTALSDRLAAEVLQLIAEGLSNVRRHTLANQVVVEISTQDDHLWLRIANRIRSKKEVLEPFVPRSIANRAAALGGKIDVQLTDETTSVVVAIPL